MCAHHYDLPCRDICELLSHVPRRHIVDRYLIGIVLSPQPLRDASDQTTKGARMSQKGRDGKADRKTQAFVQQEKRAIRLAETIIQEQEGRVRTANSCLRSIRLLLSSISL